MERTMENETPEETLNMTAVSIIISNVFMMLFIYGSALLLSFAYKSYLLKAMTETGTGQITIMLVQSVLLISYLAIIVKAIMILFEVTKKMILSYNK